MRIGLDQTSFFFIRIPFSLGQLQLGMALQPTLSNRRQWISLRLKYNILGLGRGQVWIAYLCELFVNCFNLLVALSQIHLFFFFFVFFFFFLFFFFCVIFSFLITYVPHNKPTIMVMVDREQYRDEERKTQFVWHVSCYSIRIKQLARISCLTLVMLNKIRCHAHFLFTANQFT